MPTEACRERAAALLFSAASLSTARLSKLPKTSAFYRRSHIRWWWINQVHLIIRTSLPLNSYGSRKAALGFFTGLHKVLWNHLNCTGATSRLQARLKEGFAYGGRTSLNKAFTGCQLQKKSSLQINFVSSVITFILITSTILNLSSLKIPCHFRLTSAQRRLTVEVVIACLQPAAFIFHPCDPPEQVAVSLKENNFTDSMGRQYRTNRKYLYAHFVLTKGSIIEAFKESTVLQ